MAKTVKINGLSPASTVKSAVASESWISVAGDGTSRSVSVDVNYGASSRTGYISFTSSDGASAIMPVTQYQRDPGNTLEPPTEGSTLDPPSYEPEPDSPE
jgi:hypothetical protein